MQAMKRLYSPKRFNILGMLWLWIIASLLTVYAAKAQNLKHPENCDMFYSVNNCPPGEHYDAIDGVCTQPHLANCHVTGENNEVAPSASGDLVVSFPHPDSCEKYYRIDICPKDFNFNPVSKACDYPKYKGCPSDSDGCSTLDKLRGVIMKPLRCSTGVNKIGDDCTFNCKKPLQILGSSVLTCTKSGWEGKGPYIPPKCVEPVAVAQTIMFDLSKVMEHIDGGILFVLDESGSVTAKNFEREKEFVTAVVAKLPLSVNRSAGVILFSDKSRVEVRLNTKDSCSFYKQVAAMKYRGGGTNIRLALETAMAELQTIEYNKIAVVLLTDGQSPNSTEIAEELKASGAMIFTIGVTGHDRKALESIASIGENGTYFYGIDNQEAYDSIIKYLKTEYTTKAIEGCK